MAAEGVNFRNKARLVVIVPVVIEFDERITKIHVNKTMWTTLT